MTSAEILFAILTGLAINECCEVSPWVARKLVRWSAHRRYKDPIRGEARAEELAALIDDRPGKLFKLVTAAGFAIWAIVAPGRAIVRDARTPVVRRAPTPEAQLAPVAREIPADADFDTFYRDHLPRLVGYLLARGAQPPDVADMAQEAMLEVYRHWETFRNPEPWLLLKVASRRLVRETRRRDRERMAGAMVNDFDRSVLPQQTDVASWERENEVRRLLAMLPPPQRQIMAWTIDGYRPKEIAEQLHITPAAVRSGLWKARQTLAAHLDLK
jgi:RNA polymerase sigma factor (sigma-70 family)